VADGLVDGHLLTFEGDGHGAWFASSCVRDAVGAFLVDGTVPDPGATCEE
jgi:hypothetical protein